MEDHLDLFHLRILPLLFPLWVDFSILPAICWYIFYIYFYLFLFIVFFYLSTVSIYFQYSASHLLILYIFLQYTRISISFWFLHSVLLSIYLLTYLQYTASHMLVHLSKYHFLSIFFMVFFYLSVYGHIFRMLTAICWYIFLYKNFYLFSLKLNYRPPCSRLCKNID